MSAMAAGSTPVQEEEQAGAISLEAISSSAHSQAERESLIRRNLDRPTVRAYLWNLDRLPQPLASDLERIFRSGGPWMPVLIEALAEPGFPGKARIKDFLISALERRPRRNAMPPPGDAAITFLDPFGNSLIGEGVFLVFPGTWPDSMTLSRFLDRVNEEAVPTHAFVLNPNARDALSLKIENKPLEGPAALVLDRVLQQCGLGVTYLESIALVEPEGSSCFGRPRTEQGSDAELLGKILDTLADGESAEASRLAAYKALAYLDPPGLVEGYVRELERGRVLPALHLLLHGPAFERFKVVLQESRDFKIIYLLIRTFGTLMANDAHRARLSRLLLTLPPDLVRDAIKENDLQEDRMAFFFCAALGLKGTKEIMTLLDGPEEDQRFGLLAASSCSPLAAGLFEPLWLRVSQGKLAGPDSARLVELCFLNRLAREIDDERIAELIRLDETRVCGLVLAERRGAKLAFEALMERIATGKGDREVVACARDLADRLGKVTNQSMREWSNSLSGIVDAEEKPMAARVCAAGFLAAAGEKQGTKAADLLLEGIEMKGEIRRLSLDMFSFMTGGEILPHLEALEAVNLEEDPILRERWERMILRATGWDSLAAERIRLALRKGKKPSRHAALNRHLHLMARMSSLDSYRVSVDF
ncbi:MAG: hypothetical protein ACYTG7_08805 [Planctomycetota bacterium]